MTHRTRVLGLCLVVVLVAVAPDPIPLGGSRLWALSAIVAGASVTAARTRAVDLSVGPAVGVAAVAGGVLPALAGVPASLGLATGGLAGALAGAVAGATVGRVGRQLGALATLAAGSAVVAVLAALDVTGGVVGFHAVGLPTAGGDRADALLVGAVAVGSLLAARRVGRWTATSGAAVAAADPSYAASLGRSPVRDAATVGGAGGALVGAGATLLAMVDGSVVPAAYGLELTATVLAAAAVGGAGLLGPVLGVLVVWGPSTLWPLSPIGTVPVLLVAGPLALLVLAARRGRPVTSPATRPAATDPASSSSVPPLTPAAPRTPVVRLTGTATPAGPVHLEVAAGEIVAITGPNGAGKSTLLARIGGQLPDDGTVVLHGRRAPRGPRRRAVGGLSRTWQRAPDVPADDADRLAGVLGDVHLGDLGRVLARRPRVALLDEPTDHPVDEVRAALATLTSQGAAVLLVDHRPEVVDLADRVHHLGDVGGGA